MVMHMKTRSHEKVLKDSVIHFGYCFLHGESVHITSSMWYAITYLCVLFVSYVFFFFFFKSLFLLT